MKNLSDKIFLATTKEVQDLDTSFVGIAHSDPQDIVEPIEYIRTDAFIEKACEWLKSNLYDYAGEDDKRNIVPFDEAVYEDFRNYMKGE